MFRIVSDFYKNIVNLLQLVLLLFRIIVNSIASVLQFFQVIYSIFRQVSRFFKYGRLFKDYRIVSTATRRSQRHSDSLTHFESRSKDMCTRDNFFKYFNKNTRLPDRSIHYLEHLNGSCGFGYWALELYRLRNSTLNIWTPILKVKFLSLYNSDD